MSIPHPPSSNFNQIFKSQAPFALNLRSSTTFILFVVGFSLFTDFFLYGIIVPVLPFAIKERLGLPDLNVQQTIGILLAAEAISSVIFSPLAGLIADFGNSQWAFLSGLAALLASTGLLCFGRTLTLLVLARILQGLSAAVVWTVGLALIIDTVGPYQLGRVFGTMHSIISMGSLAAPSLGGILYDRFGYYSIYIVSAIVLVFDIFLRIFMIEKSTARKFVESDGNKSTNDSDERTLLLPTPPPSHSEPDGNLDLSEDQPPTSLLARYFPLSTVMTDRGLMACMIVCFTQATLLSSFDATVPLHARASFGLGSLGSGLLFCVLQLAFLLSGPLFGWWADLRGGRIPIVMGSLGLVPLLILLGLPTSQGNGLVFYGISLGLIGISLSAIGGPSFVEANLIVQTHFEAYPHRFGERGPYGQLYAINNIMFGLGMTAGPILSSWLVDSFNYQVAMSFWSIEALLTAIICLCWLKPWPEHRPSNSSTCHHD